MPSRKSNSRMLKFRWRKSGTLLGFLLFASSVGFAGTIKGTIKFEGNPPAPKKLDMNTDPICAQGQKGPIYAETLVVGPAKQLANVFVKIKSGLPTKPYPVPTQPVVLDQKGCHYVPHVIGAQLGQKVKILNSDSTLHNVHSFSKANPPFNMAMPSSTQPKEKIFSKSEGMFNVKCDIHPWMEAWIGVVDHPFFAVSREDGTYMISGVPAGTYEIEAWHEKAGTKTSKMTVGAEETKVQDFSFSAQKK